MDVRGDSSICDVAMQAIEAKQRWTACPIAFSIVVFGLALWLLSSASGVSLHPASSTMSSSSSSNSLSTDELSKVRRFLSSIPPSSDSTASNVTFDAKRDAIESDLCRKMPGGGLNCTKILGSTTALFAAIQKMGYFCTMPVEPTSTQIQCTRITEGPVAPELDVGKSAAGSTA